MQLPSILILDKEEAIRDSLQMLLQEEGYDCFVPKDDADSKEYLNRENIDIVIACSQLIFGSSLIHEVKQEFPSVKVIAITSYLTYETCYFELMELADECILEPIDFDELLGIIKKLTPLLPDKNKED